MRNAFVVLAFAVLASCSSPASDVPEPQPAASQPKPAPVAEPALSQQCTNARGGFTVSYPAGWHTNGGQVIPACSAFDPEPVQVPPDSEIPFDIAILIDVHEGVFDGTAGDTESERVLSSERLTIGGRAALRTEVEATGMGLADRGMRTFSCSIDLGNGRSLTASTSSADAAYEQNKGILARMVETISVR